MRPLQLILGILLFFLGSAVCMAVILGRQTDPAPKYPLVVDMTGMVLFGILPLLGGLFLFYRAMQRRTPPASSEA